MSRTNSMIHTYQGDFESRTRLPIVNAMASELDASVSEASACGQPAWIMVVGQDQLTPKAFYYAKELEKLGVLTYFFSDDTSGLSKRNIESHGLHATIAPRSLIRHWLLYMQLVRRLRPRHLEVFPAARPWSLVFYVLVARLLGIPIVSWCRGREILCWTEHHWLRRLAYRTAFRASSVILLRELYMEQIFRKHRIANPERLRLCHNAVPIPPEPPVDREPTVLYLNSFKAFRNPLLVVAAARAVLSSISAQFELVGATSHLPTYTPAPNEIEQELRNRIRELGIEQSVRVLPFTASPADYYARAAVFVLPADIVFCNNSLLEAMAMGVVPIVANVEGADLIVENGVSGYIVERNADDIADRIVRLLTDDALRHRLALAARKRIEERFNSERTASSLLALYRQEVWKQQ